MPKFEVVAQETFYQTYIVEAEDKDRVLDNLKKDSPNHTRSIDWVIVTFEEIKE